ncbi:hypothetical protein L1994_10740 [Methanomicrobium antiquum]|uniref:Uncharacterized protein n=1 Tax=Methanomicrobium antiquum TaxID=487686 RepID=A0AAF0FQB7_9EURY|nr:hypothetical protein [Methanomicrobium antiquum]WFN36602.1 hypothetical protein L1994_10740 [Methanomicrobium antiquum]
MIGTLYVSGKLRVLLLSLCILIPATSAIDISGEEKTIFTAEDGAYIYAAIDSGNVLICEIYPEMDDIPGWSKLFLYKTGGSGLEELPVDNPPDSSHLDIYGNIAVWKTKSKERDWIEGQFDIYAYNLDERNAPKIIAEKFNSVNDIAIYEDEIVITGRNSIAESSDYDHGDIFVYNLEDESLTKHELSGLQSTVAISGKNLAFRDNRYGQLTAMVHLMNLETGDTWQIGDEEKGVYSFPDISGDKIVYKFDDDFGSFLKDNPPQKLLMTDISTNETIVITSPDAQVASPKIDGDNIVWSDKRNGIHYSVWIYNINEENEILISDTNGEYGVSVEISGDSVIWKDSVNGRNVLKLIKLDLPEISVTVTETPQNTEDINSETENKKSPTQAANLSSGLTVAAVIFCLCFFAVKKKQVTDKNR